MQMVNEFFPLLVATKGTIVNHGSMVRSLPHPFTSAYNASKAALSQYSNTLRLELEPLDVKVVELVSGRIATGLITVPTLAEASIYKPLEQILQSRAREAGTSPHPLTDKNIKIIDGCRNPTKGRSIC
jgi:1-acylglycerone phosphate reductase